jgi:hypothetical protein
LRENSWDDLSKVDDEIKRTINGDVDRKMFFPPLYSDTLDELAGFESLFPDARLGVELPEMRALIEDKHVALGKTRCFKGHFADNQSRAIKDTYAVELADVRGWRG